METTISPPTITCDQALKTARLDAENKYGDLRTFRIEVFLEDDGWHVNYRFQSGTSQGGEPHYIIDAASGEIIKKRYYQ